MINDTIDIIRCKIVNLQINIDIISEEEKNKFEVLQNGIDAIKFEILSSKYDIGEPLRVSDIFRTLKNVDGILDVIGVNVKRKIGSFTLHFHMM
jgi:uncharacterized phage protein gp47/JayE